MRVVLDTNVFVSGVFFSGPPYLILDAWRKGLLEIIISPNIFDEYCRVGEELSVNFPGVDIMPALELIAVHAIFVNAPGLTGSVCRDPDDDKFLACAFSGKCDIIVTGDKDLLSLGEYGGVVLVSPRTFLEKYLMKSI